MPLLQHLCQLLNDSSFGTMIRESDYAYSIIESVHVLAITLVVGTIAILDLRMLGVILRPIAVTRIARAVLPLTWSGFASQLPQRLPALLGGIGKDVHQSFFPGKAHPARTGWVESADLSHYGLSPRS
jgi:hypothetical protein